jgi:hypothetical protein
MAQRPVSIRSPLLEKRKSQLVKDLQPGETSVALPVALPTGKPALLDADLAAVIDAWPTLPVAIKLGIFAMVRAAAAED